MAAGRGGSGARDGRVGPSGGRCGGWSRWRDAAQAFPYRLLCGVPGRGELVVRGRLVLSHLDDRDDKVGPGGLADAPRVQQRQQDDGEGDELGEVVAAEPPGQEAAAETTPAASMQKPARNPRNGP